MRDLPSGWEAADLSALVELNPKTTDLADDTLVGFVPMALLGTSYLDTMAFQPKPWAEVKRGYTHFQDGDVLLAKITPCFENGKAGVVRGLPNGVGAGSTEYYVCRPRHDAVDARYLLAFLKSSSFVNEGAARMTGSVGHKRVPKEYLSEQCLPLAPRGEQTRIADQLDTLLARVNACNDHLDAIPGILKRFRQAVLATALAESWPDVDHPAPRTAKLSQVAFVGTGSTPLRSTSSFYADSGTPWVTSAATGKPFVAEADQFVTKAAIAAHRLKTYPRGTLLIAMYGEGKTRGQVSELAIEATINQACAAICVDEAKASRKFVKLVLTANYLAMRELAEGGNQPNLNLTKIKEFDIPLPTLDAQEATVRRAEALLAVAQQIEAKYKVARAHAQRLAPQVLAKAFRGELVEQDPQDEPASVLLQRLAVSQPSKESSSRGRPRAQAKPQPPAPDRPPTEWASLPDGAWTAPADPDGHATTVWLTAVLRAWGAPMPERAARLATLLCQQPHLFTPMLPAAQARLWSRLVGDAAAPLPAQVTRLQPASNHPWGRAVQGMRIRGDLVEAGTGDDLTWALGPGAAAMGAAGWSDGRAGFVVAHLRAHGLASILPALAPAEQAFVNARAA